jgi:hypothetical protein
MDCEIKGPSGGGPLINIKKGEWWTTECWEHESR